MVSDQEPRYRLVDSNGNIVGSLYGKADGSIAIQETDSGADREVTRAPAGTFSAPSVETESVSTEVLETDGPEGWGEPVVEFDDDPDAEDITVSLDSQTEEGDEVLIDLVRFEPASSGELRLTVDTGGDGDYSYQMSNATSPSQNANFVQLVDMSDSFAGVSGRIILREVSFGVAVIQKLAGGRADRINAIVSFGSVDATGVGDITFSLHDVGDREFREMTFDVYQRSRFDL